MDLEQASAAKGALERHLAGQLAATLARPDEAETRMALAAAGEVYRDIAPRDALEKLLAVQMIAGHEAALDGFARARLAEDGRDRQSELRLAARLSTLFARQTATLRRHRVEARRAREAADKQAAREAAARTEAQQAEPRGGGVLVVPRGVGPGDGCPWPDPEGLAAALAENRARAEDRAQARPAPAARGRPRAAPASEPGYLVVPAPVSPEEWTRRVQEHDRKLKASG